MAYQDATPAIEQAREDDAVKASVSRTSADRDRFILLFPEYRGAFNAVKHIARSETMTLIRMREDVEGRADEEESVALVIVKVDEGLPSRAVGDLLDITYHTMNDFDGERA